MSYNSYMAKDLILGRSKEKEILQSCYESKESQLVIITGRRRIGKSFLINQYFDDSFAFKLVGDKKLTKNEQLFNFRQELQRKTQNENLLMPKDWSSAFAMLRDYIENQDKETKQVVFFDEMPWLDNQKSGFLTAFEYFWNSYGAAKNNLMFIVCGSSTSWIVDNFDHNKGGLFNRQNKRIFLEPFTLKETEEYLEKKKNIIWSRYDIAQCYMIFGGVPYYLDQLEKGISLNANIDNLCFKRRGVLFDEFFHLYNTLFYNSEKYIKIAEFLSTKRLGYTRKEICDKAKISNNSDLTKILDNLVYSGFVREYQFFGKKKKDILYQLNDYFSIFYFNFMKDNPKVDDNYWANTIDMPARKAWSGFTFEQVCKDHIDKIKKVLGISGVYCEQSQWFTKGDDTHPGAQIDLLIDRRDRIINICEIKFSINQFTIDKDIDQALRNKIGIFKSITKTNKAINLVMITTFGITKNKYSSVVQNEVTLDDLFS